MYCFDETVDQHGQNSVVHTFYNNDEQQIRVVTNRSGGLRRAFTPADGVVHLTPCYSPSLTAQCTDCVVRYTQERKVYFYHHFARRSIEMRVEKASHYAGRDGAGQAVKEYFRMLDVSNYNYFRSQSTSQWQARDTSRPPPRRLQALTIRSFLELSCSKTVHP